MAGKGLVDDVGRYTDSEAGVSLGKAHFDGVPTPHEQKLAQELADQGLDVQIRGANQAGPDALIADGYGAANY